MSGRPNAGARAARKTVLSSGVATVRNGGFSDPKGFRNIGPPGHEYWSSWLLVLGTLCAQESRWQNLPAQIGRILPDIGEFRPGQDEPQHLLDAAER